MHTGIERIADLLHEQVPGSDIMTKYCNPHCACQGLYTRSIIGHLLYRQFNINTSGHGHLSIIL